MCRTCCLLYDIRFKTVSKASKNKNQDYLWLFLIFLPAGQAGIIAGPRDLERRTFYKLSNMKNIIYCLAFAGLLTGCSQKATKVNISLKTTQNEAKQFNRMAILVLFPSMSNRANVELALDNKLTSLGVNSMSTFDVFPFAGDKELLEKMNLTGEALREKIREKIKIYEIDGLMTISLLDAKQEERFVQGSSMTISGPVHYGAYPEYQYAYYDYYAYATGTVFDNSYYETTTTYFLETNLYDIATEKLIWTCQTETQDPTSVEKEAKKFAEIIANELFSKKVIKKGS